MLTVLSLAVGLAVLVVGIVIRSRRSRATNDEIFSGVTPGVIPPGGAPVERLPVQEYAGEVAVAFSPPRDVIPALMGTLVDGRADNHDVVATVVDLAVRGWLTIQVVDADGTVVRASEQKGGRTRDRDWLLTQSVTRPRDQLMTFEADLLSVLFRKGSPVRLSEIVRANGFKALRGDLLQGMTTLGWYANGDVSDRFRPFPVVLGAMVVLSGLAVLAGLPALVLGVPLLLVGVWLAQAPRRATAARTATGTALRIQSLGFKRYLETAEAAQFSFEEAAGIFSRYLPYAIVLGVAQQWAKVFGDVLVAARDAGYAGGFELSWLDTYLMVDALSDLVLLDTLGDIGGITDIADGLWSGDGALGVGDGFDIGDLGGTGSGGGFDLSDLGDFGDFGD